MFMMILGKENVDGKGMLSFDEKILQQSLKLQDKLTIQTILGEINKLKLHENLINLEKERKTKRKKVKEFKKWKGILKKVYQFSQIV